ncbi:MAG: site-specific integrase, partial [Flavobacteriales bacterium]|nr:site-specific integrase [Flavobacteriales bacterium]
MSWKQSIKEFKSYLKIERSLSDNTIDSYLRDVRKLAEFSEEKELDELQITKAEVKEFIAFINTEGISARSQSRIISGIKAFYKYLILEDYLTINPTELIESPKIGLKLPDTLSIFEIDSLISAI